MGQQRQVLGKETKVEPSKQHSSEPAKAESATPEWKPERKEVKNSHKIVEKLVYWIVFSVIVALVPFLVDISMRYIKGKPFDLASIFSHGELLILSAAICASGLGELLKSRAKKRNLAISVLKGLVGGGCVIIILFTSAIFGQIGTESIDGVQKVWFISRFAGSCAFIATGFCMIISEID